nr:hypothetical protein CFP56_78746 [Quercus suber]
MCGPDSGFAKYGWKELELDQEDDEDALQAMLSWLYTFDYESARPPEVDRFTFTLRLYTTALKYGLVRLRTKVAEDFQCLLEDCDYEDLIDAAEKVYGDEPCMYLDDIVKPLTTAINTQLQWLMEHEKFTDLLMAQPEFAVTVLRNKVDNPLGLDPEMVVMCGPAVFTCGHVHDIPMTLKSSYDECPGTRSNK